MWKRGWPLGLGLMLLAAMAGCGVSGGGAYGVGGNPGSTPATSSSGSGSVATATAMVGGNSETILTDGGGKTLYYFDPDTSTSVACTGGCAQTWPPLLAGSNQTQTPSGLSGTFSTVSRSEGKQITYNGHPLYTYSGDSAAGQTNGDGIQGKWHVATPNIPVNGGGGGSGTPTPYGYSY